MNNSDQQGLLFDHYEVERVLGRGAMGVVYLACDLRIGRLAALKTIQRRLRENQDEGFVERFQREAELCGHLHHPNIVTLYDIGYEGRRISYLAMEYVDGESLLSLMRRQKKLGFEAAVRVIGDVLSGLAYAHERGIIHRDIKPANILLALDGRAKITDFGVARSIEDNYTNLTGAGQLLGTPFYMAPEHVAGRELDGRCDLFSVGVMFYELVVGKKPFEGEGVIDVLYNVVNEPAPAIVDEAIPDWCIRFINKLLEKSPDNRFPSAAAALTELRRQAQSNGFIVDHGTMSLTLQVAREEVAEETPTTPLRVTDVVRARRWKWSDLRRPVSDRFSMPLIASLAAVALTMVLTFARHANEPVPDAARDQQITSELQQKKILMSEANVLMKVGAFGEAKERFDEYLRRYPWSVAARQGSVAAQRAIEEQTLRIEAPEVALEVIEPAKKTSKKAATKLARKETMRITSVEPPPVPEASTATVAEQAPASTDAQPGDKPLSRWQRFKRAIGRK